MSEHRDAVRAARSIVVKIGTTALTDASGLFDATRLAALAEAIEARMKAGTDVVIVSSGAVAAGLRLDRGVFTVCVPAEVQYRGLLRARQMSAGMPAALVLADPAVRDLVESTARANGVPVRMADDDALEVAARRAAAIRGLAGQAAAVVGALLGQTGTRSSA